MNKTLKAQFKHYRLRPDQARGLEKALQTYQALVEEHENLARIEKSWRKKPRCNGSIYFRDGRYMQLHHTPAQVVRHGPCPLHGSRDDGKRLVSYVGTDAAAIEEAQEIVENWQGWQEITHKQAHIALEIQRMNDALDHLINLMTSNRQDRS